MNTKQLKNDNIIDDENVLSGPPRWVTASTKRSWSSVVQRRRGLGSVVRTRPDDESSLISSLDCIIQRTDADRWCSIQQENISIYERCKREHSTSCILYKYKLWSDIDICTVYNFLCTKNIKIKREILISICSRLLGFEAVTHAMQALIFASTHV